MKHTAKRFAALLAALVLVLCLSIPAFAAAPLVRDEMGLFDADTYSELETSAEAASDGLRVEEPFTSPPENTRAIPYVWPVIYICT